LALRLNGTCYAVAGRACDGIDRRHAVPNISRKPEK